MKTKIDQARMQSGFSPCGLQIPEVPNMETTIIAGKLSVCAIPTEFKQSLDGMSSCLRLSPATATQGHGRPTSIVRSRETEGSLRSTHLPRMTPRRLHGRRRNPPNATMRTFPLEIVALFMPGWESALHGTGRPLKQVEPKQRGVCSWSLAAGLWRWRMRARPASRSLAVSISAVVARPRHGAERSLICSQSFFDGSVLR